MITTQIMYLLSLTLSLVCFTTMVSGDIARKKHPNFECALHRCSVEDVNCDSALTSSRCCSVCPKERRCLHKGKWYDSGTSFKDSCNSCFCHDGRPLCTMRACLDLACFYKGKRYSDGSSFKDECNTCRCTKGNVACTKIGCVNGCSYKGKYYKDGESFKDDCNTCRCRQGQVGCTKIGCPSKKCKYNGIFYMEGQLIPSKNPCSKCYCRKGRRQCSFTACLAVFCEGQRRIPGQCCPFCPDITM